MFELTGFVGDGCRGDRLNTERRNRWRLSTGNSDWWNRNGTLPSRLLRLQKWSPADRLLRDVEDAKFWIDGSSLEWSGNFGEAQYFLGRANHIVKPPELDAFGQAIKRALDPEMKLV